VTPNRIVWLYPKLTSWMGGQRFVFEVCKRLNQKYEVVVVGQQVDQDVRSAYEAEGITITNMDVPTFTDLRFWGRFRASIARDGNSLRSALRQGDVVITSMFPMNCVAAAAGVPFVQVAYEPFAMFFDQHFQNGQRFPIRLFCRAIAKRFSQADIAAVRSASALLTLSQFERTNCANVYGRDSSVILEGVDTEFFRPRPDPSLEARYRGRTVVFHSTGFDSFKGTAALMAAMPELVRRVPNLKLLMSQTRSDEAALSAFSGFIAREGVADNVEFLGFLDFDDLPAYYSLARLYLEPGTGRSMSLSSKEANACGTPSVRGKVGTEDTVDGVSGILVDPQNPAEMARRIANLLSDSSQLASMGLAARNEVVRNYSWDAVVERIEGHFQYLVSEDAG